MLFRYRLPFAVVSLLVLVQFAFVSPTNGLDCGTLPNSVSVACSESTQTASLNPDSTLNLPATVLTGSTDGTDYHRLVSEPGGQPRFVQNDANLPAYATDNANWDPRFDLEGMSGGTISALAWDGANLYAGGSFTAAGSCTSEDGCNYIARWDGRKWHPLGTGMDSTVTALTWDGANLYAGGTFLTAGGTSANYIAKWDGNNWSALGTGMNLTVRALLWDGTHLYAGGAFTSAGTCTTTDGCNRIARWNGSTWSALGTGMNNTVLALETDGTLLYAGGRFSSPGWYIAAWDGNSWAEMPGISGSVAAVGSLLWNGEYLYVGGSFTSPYFYITRWDGSSWSSLPGSNGPIRSAGSLTWDGHNLYASVAHFSQGLMRWNGSSWVTLGVSTSVYALAWDGDSLYSSLYVGGQFNSAGGKPANNIARWRLAAIWDGGGVDNNASTAANWSGNGLPLTNDVIIFDSTSTKDAVLDSDFVTELTGIVIEDSYSGTVTQDNPLNITGQLHLHGGTLVVPDPAAATLAVNDEIVHTGGIIKQTQSVNAATVPFLQIENGASEVKYRGVTVDTTLTGSNLGNTGVSVRAINASAGEFCTSDGELSPDYAERCYEIQTATNGAATVRLWALADQLNGISEEDLVIYRHIGSGNWTPLTNITTGSEGDYAYAEGDTPGFSFFLLGEQDETPTAIAWTNIKANSVWPINAPILMIIISFLILGTSLITWHYLYSRHSSSP